MENSRVIINQNFLRYWLTEGLSPLIWQISTYTHFWLWRDLSFWIFCLFIYIYFWNNKTSVVNNKQEQPEMKSEKFCTFLSTITAFSLIVSVRVN